MRMMTNSNNTNRSSSSSSDSDSDKINFLPWGDINILVVTDVHSWVGGHRRHEYDDNGSINSVQNNDPSTQKNTINPRTNDADYGHLVSLYERLKAQQQQDIDGGGDLFFFMNGDFMDGTGLSTIPPNDLIPILKCMPWDAVNVGNHELYQNETVEFLLQKNGFIDHWNGTYLSSNTYVTVEVDEVMLKQQNNYHRHRQMTTARTFGSKFTYLTGTNQGTRILTFGFLFNFKGNCPMTYVEEVEETAQQEWFIAEILYGSYDCIVILAHMDCEDELVYHILRSIRQLLLQQQIVHSSSSSSSSLDTNSTDKNNENKNNKSNIPILFLTGHTHRRAFSLLLNDPTMTQSHGGTNYDNNDDDDNGNGNEWDLSLKKTTAMNPAASFEAGHYFDTVGFISINLPKNLKNSKKGEPLQTMANGTSRRIITTNATNTSTSTTDNNDTNTIFRYKFIDTNQEVMRQLVQVPVLQTPNGLRVSRLINETRKRLRLDEVVGYVDRTYRLTRPIQYDDSLWGLYVNNVIPATVLSNNNSRKSTNDRIHDESVNRSVNNNNDTTKLAVFIQSTGALRYDLLKGNCTVDDLIAVSPFYDTFVRFYSSTTDTKKYITTSCQQQFTGTFIQQVLDVLNNNNNNNKIGTTNSSSSDDNIVAVLPQYASACSKVPTQSTHMTTILNNTPCTLEPTRLYDIITGTYDSRLIRQAIESIIKTTKKANLLFANDYNQNHTCIPLPYCNDVDDDNEFTTNNTKDCWNTTNVWTTYYQSMHSRRREVDSTSSSSSSTNIFILQNGKAHLLRSFSFMYPMEQIQIQIEQLKIIKPLTIYRTQSDWLLNIVFLGSFVLAVITFLTLALLVNRNDTSTTTNSRTLCHRGQKRNRQKQDHHQQQQLSTEPIDETTYLLPEPNC